MAPRRSNGTGAFPKAVEPPVPARPNPDALYAALDLGTNSCRMLIAQPKGSGFHVVDSFAKSVQLGAGLERTGRLSRASMARTIQALRICQQKLRRNRVTHMRLVATEACRRAKNSREFIRQVKRETGLTLEIIQPEEEARLAVISCAPLVSTQTEQLLVVDIGGGTTDMAIFTGGSIRHTAVIPIAGDQVTNDIAMALRTPTQNADEIKIKYACALTQLAGADETIKVPSVGDRPPRDLSRQALAEVVEPRYEELFTLIQSELRRSGFEDLIAAGLVLTGGTSKMEGAVELAEEIFHMPVRLASPQGVTGLADVVNNPMYSTGVGLLMYGLKQQGMGIVPAAKSEGEASIFERLKNWIAGNF